MNEFGLIGTAAGAVGGYLLKYFLDKRGEAESRRFKDKREHYRNLILAIKLLAERDRDGEKSFWWELTFLWLYAPDSVMKSANAVARILKKPPSADEELSKSLGDLLLNMRRDLGFKRIRMISGDYLSKSA